MGRHFDHDEEQSDFCVVGSAPEHRLSQFERLTLVGGRDLERALAFVGRQILQFSSDESLRPFDPAVVAQAIAAYPGGGTAALVERYFPPPPEHIPVSETPVHGLSGGVVVDLTFPSFSRSTDSLVESARTRHPENRVAHARWWRHNGGAAATIVAVHGWAMGDQRLNSLAFLPGIFFRAGLDVVLFELPFHGRRRHRAAIETGRGGILFPSTDLVLTNEAMFQALGDLRVLRRYLSGCGAGDIGTIGMSLGAYVGALWAALDAVSFAVSVVPLVSMGELAWDIVARNPHLGAIEAGVTLELLEQVFQSHCPLSFPARLAPERALIIAALGDHLVPRQQPERLWEHWGRPAVEWVSGGHDTLFHPTVAGARVAQFLDRLGYIKFRNFADLPPAA